MKILVTFTLILLCSFNAYNQFWGSSTTSNFTNEAIDVEIDNSGNIYVAGYISGETSFNINTVQTSALGNGDIYVAKYNSTGSLLWIKQFGGNFSDRPTDLCLGDANTIYITGQYYGQVAFGSTTLNSVNNSKDIFLLKLDNQGNVLWAKSEGGAGNENAYGITADNQNNLILTGQFSGSSTLAGQNFNSVIDPSTALPSYDIFLAKYDLSGSPLWLKTGQTEYEDRGLAVSCDDQNNIFVTGQFSDTLVFAGSTFNNMGYNVGFYAKFTPNGQLSWLNQLRAGMVIPYDLEVNSLNEVVLIGDFLGNMNYYTTAGTTNISNTYSKKIFSIKTTNDGAFLWGTTLGSNNEISARSISIDSAKNTYITGYFKCDLSQIHDTNTALFNSVGFKDPYLLKISNSGGIIYTKQFGGKQNDEGFGVAISLTNEPIICGSFTENLNIPSDQNATYAGSNFNNFNFNYVPYSPVDFVYSFGDLSRNSFLTNAVNSNTPDYNFFVSQPTDTLYGFIIPTADTVDFCDSLKIEYNPQTDNSFGPAYNYTWSTGQTTKYIWVQQTNTYNVQVERKDQCSMGQDTIFAIHHNDPPLPLMTDNLGIAVNNPGIVYANYNFCAPDSVQTWFSNLCLNCDISIKQDTTNLFNDTLPHYYSDEAWYYVNIQDSFCTNKGRFHINLDYVVPFDTIQPYLYFTNDPDDNDTITTCADNNLYIHIYDYLTNPDTTLNLFNLQPTTYYTMSINPAMYGQFISSNHFIYRFEPVNSGWYTFNYWVSIGYDNLCGLDTLQFLATDSIYIVVNPLPNISTAILGDNLLCPNGSAYLYLTDTIPGFNWSGPGIEWANQAGDSIQVSSAGTHHYFGILTDTITGCSKNLSFNHLLQMKQPPTISMNPEDGIVCPNDSVSFWLPNTYVSYDWVGPDGFNISVTNTAIDDDLGFYYCHVIDNEGCSLTTTPVELKEFTTPSLYVEPYNVICLGGSANITVTYLGNAVIQWTSPIISTSDEIVATQIGYYVCEIQQCGMTFLDSVEIMDGSFQISISTDDTLLCYTETALATTNTGYNDYQWSNGTMGTNIISITDAGFYSVNVTNQFGCIAHSDTIQIETETSSIPPLISDITICPGSNATLSEISGSNLNWYDSDTTFLQSSQSIQLSSVNSDTIILAAYNVLNCPTVFTEITISILDSLPHFEIIGDSLLCPLESTLVSVHTNTETVQWYINGTAGGTGNTYLYTASLNSPSFDQIDALISNACFSDTLSFFITTVQPEILSLALDSLLICNYSTIPLSAIGIFDTLIWNSQSGYTSIVDTFNLTTLEGNGFIYVQGIDTNGCSTNSDSIYISASQLTFDLFQITVFSCFNDSIVIGVNTNSDSISWETPFGTFSDTNEFNLSISNSTAGWYTLLLWDSIGCIYTDSTFLNPNSLPQFEIPNDTLLCLNDWLEFTAFNDSILYSWEGIGVVDSIPVIANQWYVITATSLQGCTYSDSIFVNAINCDDELPNVITANGDGINDFFIIDEAPIFKNNRLTITNRWGNIVFEMDTYDNTFNGYDLSDGTYFYVFIYDTRSNENVQKTGFLHIIK